jgi:threonine/homoserine/homoserine lactone efflux protein
LQEIFQLGIGFIIALSGALIPGPLLVFVLSKSMSTGVKVGPLTVVGHLIVEIIIIGLIFLGLGFILQVQLFQIIVGLVGGILLMIFGTLNIIKANRNNFYKSNMIGLGYHPIIGGIIFSTILNPTVPLWWATIGLAMLMEALLTAAILGLIFWIIGHFLADLTWYSFVSYLTWKGREIIGLKVYKMIIIVCGVVLLFFGVYFILKYGFMVL